MDKLKEIFIPSLIASAVSVGIYKFVLDEDLSEPTPFLNMEIPAYAAVGGSSLVGNIAGEFLSDIVIPRIPKISALGAIQEMIVPPAITGLSTYGAISLLVNKNAPFTTTFMLGAGSSVLGKYAYQML